MRFHPVMCALIACAPPTLAGDRVLTDFTAERSLRWQTVNDGVMGGRSRGGSARTDRNTLVFKGTISLENNGGFSSIRTRPQALDLSEFEGISVRVKGDGRTYKVSLRTSTTNRWIAYWAKLPTKQGEWTTVRLPWSAWRPTTFGRTLRGPALAPSKINSVGFMLYDKKAGPFRLEVDRISAFSGAAPTASATKGSATEGKASSGKASIVATAQKAGAFTTLLTAAKAAGLVDALSAAGPLTVFAPTDAAFGEIPAAKLRALLEPQNKAKLVAILKYHVVAGRVTLADLLAGKTLQTLNGASLQISAGNGSVLVNDGPAVKTAQIDCTNGVIHVIDQVLVPELGSIVEVATKAKTFQTLLAAAKAAGLAEVLANAGPLTVFAPTDAAFAKLPPGTVATLLRPENKAALVRVLKHHVVSGRITAAQAASAGKVKTLAGTTLAFGYADGRLKVGKVNLTALDLPALNGVVHVVDQVLLPPKQITPTLSLRDRARSLIQTAIDRGVPLFNQGNPAACRAIYELTATALLNLRGSLFSPKLRATLRAALSAPAGDSDGSAHAWKLRRALDSAFAELGGHRDAF